ncbi:MAG: hypothetical protein QOI08_3420, partial [Actinomycetota bacterium]|nr:hypothetical protein [Actinomycetota bacterium]
MQCADASASPGCRCGPAAIARRRTDIASRAKGSDAVRLHSTRPGL